MTDHSSHQRWTSFATTLTPAAHLSHTESSQPQSEEHGHPSYEKKEPSTATPNGSRKERHHGHHELDASTWKIYWDRVPEADKQTYKSWNSDLDSLLIFATLFSAVVTAFVIDTYKTLLPDSGDASLAIQRRILLNQLSAEDRQLFLQDEAVGQGLKHSNMVIVNALWFASLILSLATTFFTIMAKQWVLYLSENLASAPKVRGRQRQYRQHNIERWRLPIILRCLPIFLHIALLLFFAGLAEFTMQLDNTVYAVTLSLVVLTSFVYVGAHMLSFIFVSCPYKTSVTLVLLPFVASLLKEITTFVFVGWYASYYASFAMRQARQHVRGTERGQRYYTLHSLWSYSMRFRTHCSRLADKTVPWLNLARWEHKAIRKDRTILDIRALAWIIRQSLWTENTREIALELCRVGDVLQHRSLLIDSGVLPLLAHEFKTACDEDALRNHPETVATVSHKNKDPYPTHSKEFSTEIIQRAPAILAKLVTESFEDDLDTAVSFVPNGLPYNRDVDDSVKSHLRSTGVFRIHVFNEGEDLVHFANLLRLQTCVLPPGRANFPAELKDSIKLFLARMDKDEISPLNDEELITVVNTLLFVGVCWRYTPEATADSSISSISLLDSPSTEKGNSSMLPDTSNADADGERFLKALETVMKYRPHMGFTVRRQICYGIWALSNDFNRTHDMSDALIPIFKKTKSIYGVLTKLLTERMDNWTALRAALHLLQGVSADSNSREDRKERQLFLQAFVDKIPEISEEFCNLDIAAFNNPSFSVIYELLLQVWYLAFLQYQEDGSRVEDGFEATVSHIIGNYGMIDVLRNVAEHLNTPEAADGGASTDNKASADNKAPSDSKTISSDKKYRLRIATYGAACRLITLHMRGRHPVQDAPTDANAEDSPVNEKTPDNTVSIQTLNKRRNMGDRTVSGAMRVLEQRRRNTVSSDIDDTDVEGGHENDQAATSVVELHPISQFGGDYFDFTNLDNNGVVVEFAEAVRGLVAASAPNADADTNLAVPNDHVLMGFMEILANAKLDADIDSQTHTTDKISFSEAFNSMSQDIEDNLRTLMRQDVSVSLIALRAFAPPTSGVDNTRTLMERAVGAMKRNQRRFSLSAGIIGRDRADSNTSV